MRVGADPPFGRPCWPPAVAQALASPAWAGTALDRTVLPIAEPQHPPATQLDVRNATPPPPFAVTAPEGAPNVIVILIDDLGFAGTGAFGSPISTPTFDRLAGNGVHYNNFHTTAVSSPTRSAIKSGRNHHRNNMGGIIGPARRSPATPGRFPMQSPRSPRCCA